MRIALAQLNPLIGDLQGNAERILQAGTVAAAAGADLLLTPELSLWGYPPRDLLLRPLLVQQQMRVLQELSRALPAPLRALVGTVDPVPGCTTPRLWNAMALLYGGGGWQTVVHKQLLPSYDVFDETRYFIPGKSSVSLALEPGGYPLYEDQWKERERQGEISPDRMLRLGITICEDLWVEDDLQEWRTIGNDAIQDLAAQGVDLLLNLSASPYGRGKLPLRRRLAARAAQRLGCTMLYLNQVGGNDELVFDGASFAIGADGTPLWQAASCREQLILWDAIQPHEPALELELPPGRWSDPPPRGGGSGQMTSPPAAAAAPARPLPPLQPLASTAAGAASGRADRAAAHDDSPEAVEQRALSSVPQEMEQLLRALVLGVRDYGRKCGFQTALLGLSGGIDSALVAVIASAALGAERVRALRLPSPWSSRGSLDDAEALADRLGIDLHTLAIAPLMQAFDTALSPALGEPPQGVTAENLQSRIRGTALMALANQSGALLLSTGNKSELAVGYCTLYGDMNGGLAVIGDLYKTTVFELCDWLDSPAAAACRAELGLPAQGELIGAAIRHKPPSAELRPDQRDSDTLPAYEVLDPLLRQSIERMASPEQLIAAGTDPELAQRVDQLLRRAEFKRRQAPPVLKVSSRSFGGGWRMPIAAA
jgi:NAD+ synthase (glutamine-hydrolysing)